MKKTTEFNKNNIKALRVEMDQAMQSISKKYGIEIQTGNASFSSNEVTFKVKANTVGTDGAAITKEAMQFEREKGLHGLGHLNIGDTIMIQGNPYTLNGFNRRATKAPIQFSNSKGNYKCSIQMLKDENGGINKPFRVVNQFS
jgi:hypothetical protein